MGDQIERCIEITKRVFDRYLKNFEDFACDQKDFVEAGTQFGVYLVPREES
jgi:hypothetical protein